MTSSCTSRFNIKYFNVLPTECIYAFCMDLRRKTVVSLHSINWLVFTRVRKLRKATISSVLSARPHGTTRLPPDGFSIKFDIFVENLLRKFKFYQTPTRIMGTINEDVFTFKTISGQILLRTGNVLNESCRGNQTHVMFSKVYPKIVHLWDNIEKRWSQRGYKWRRNMAHTWCMLDK